MLWNKIYNPETHTIIDLNTKQGEDTLRKYLLFNRLGGGKINKQQRKKACAINVKSGRCSTSNVWEHDNCILSDKNYCKMKVKEKIGKKKIKKIKIKKSGTIGKKKKLLKTIKNSGKTGDNKISCSFNSKTGRCSKSNSWDRDKCSLSAKKNCKTIKKAAEIKVKKITKISNKMKRKKIILKKKSKGPKLEEFIKKIQNLIHKHRVNLDNDPTAYFKTKVYTDLIVLLSSYPYKTISSLEHIEEFIKTNGFKNPVKIINKLKEFIKTGTIKEADNVLNIPIINAVINLTKVYSIGPAKAKALYMNHTIQTIDELRTGVLENLKDTNGKAILNSKQLLGLTYYDDLQMRIPRTEMDSYNKLLKQIALSISPNIIFTVAGSYRRGLESSGDIDIIISSSDRSEDTSLLRKKFIAVLISKNIIIETLAGGKKKFMGICKLSSYGYSIARHIDIIDTPYNVYPFALFYFTGSGGFNTHVRAKALTLGYSLNERQFIVKKTKKPLDSLIIMSKIGKPIIETEQDIFDVLGIKYLAPKDRSILTLSKI